MIDAQEDVAPASALAPDIPVDENEFCDLKGATWIRKHPSSGICAAYMTVEDLNYLAGKHQAAAFRSEQIGDNIALVHHTLTRARFVALAATLSVQRASKLDEERSTSSNIAKLNSAGFDQDGRQWIPRRPTEDLLCVPLSVQELKALHTFYGELAALTTNDADGTKWATCEKKRSTLERQVSELDVEAAERLRQETTSPRKVLPLHGVIGLC